MTPSDVTAKPVSFLPGDPPGPCPDLMTEEELIAFLRIPQVTSAKDPHNVIENLKRMHDLPRLHMCGKVLYPRKAILKWIEDKTTIGT